MPKCLSALKTAAISIVPATMGSSWSMGATKNNAARCAQTSEFRISIAPTLKLDNSYIIYSLVIASLVRPDIK